MIRRVLLVDDDDAALLTLVALLEDEGFEVVTASSLEDARALLDDSPPFHAVVVDRHVDDDDGLELLGPTRAKDPATRFALHSGDPPEQLPDVDAWLVKAAPPLQILLAIRALADAAVSRSGAGS